MSAIRLDDGYGYLTFEFDPPAGSPAAPPVKLDLYAANAAYLRAHAEAPDNPWPGFCAYLAAVGFPDLSHMNAAKVIRAVQAEIERLGKADAGSGSAG